MGFYTGANKQPLVGTKNPRLADFDGQHELKVLSIRKGDLQQIYWAADLEILTSTNAQLKPGTKVGWVTTRDAKYPAYFFSDIKRFLAAWRGEDVEAIDEVKMEESEAANFAGLGCQINALVTRGSRLDKKTNLPYGNVTFSPAQ